MKTFIHRLGCLALPLLCGLLSAGCCSLGKPASASFASVAISGKTAGEIRDATIAVFRENVYQVFGSSEGLTFEKEGTKGNTLAHEGPFAAYQGAVTIIRVRASLVALGSGVWRLQCQAYMVSGAGDSFFENEHKLADFRSGPYQDLLDEVARRLKQP
jgi:hypothetical protein